MTLTIKNADNTLFEAIKKIIELSPNKYELAKSPEDIYADEVREIIRQVENGEMKTYNEEEYKIEMANFKEKLREKYANI